jgi:hypothetical protein
MRNKERGRWVARCALALGLGVVILGGVPSAYAANVTPSEPHVVDVKPVPAAPVDGTTTTTPDGGPIATTDEFIWT